jgi:hypothetical protein
MRKSDAQYQIIRQSSHDGTFAFTYELLSDTVLNLVSMDSFAKNYPPDEFKKVVAINYTIGPLWLSTVYGRVKLRVGEYPGQRERTRMSVACTYIYAEDMNGE